MGLKDATTQRRRRRVVGKLQMEEIPKKKETRGNANERLVEVNKGGKEKNPV